LWNKPLTVPASRDKAVTGPNGRGEVLRFDQRGFARDRSGLAFCFFAARPFVGSMAASIVSSACCFSAM